MRDIALRNGTLDRNTVSGWNSRADISGNARHFCDGELNSMIREKAVRNESLDQPNASIVKNDVRMGWEVDVVSAFPSSTTGYEPSRPEMERWTGIP